MFDFIKDLDPKIIVALIGIPSAILSAIIGGIISRWHTSAQFQEELQKLRLERLNEQNDSYLKNAREQIGAVYIPLSAELAALKAAFQRYVYQGKTEEHLFQFSDRIEDFISELQALESRGATAYVTTDLEDLLIKFVAFLRASKSSTDTVVAITYNFSLGLFGFGAKKDGAFNVRSSRAARPGISASVSVAGVGTNFQVSDIIQAPIASDNFQEKFERDAYRLSVLIREVTLGSVARVA